MIDNSIFISKILFFTNKVREGIYLEREIIDRQRRIWKYWLYEQAEQAIFFTNAL